MDLAEKARSIPQGTHACFFFDNPDQQIAMVVPFLQAGLEKNERCLFLGNSVNVQIVRNALKLAGTDVEREENRGALLLSSERPYLNHGYFDHKAVIQFIEIAIEDALRYGFSALRGTGDVVWELGSKSEVEVL